MQTIRATSLCTAFFAAALLTGCAGLGGIFGDDDRNDRNDRYDPDRRVEEVEGTIERVDTRDRLIVVDGRTSSYRSDLRNGDDEIVLYYDDRTVVEHEGRAYRPEDLEAGDRIRAEVDQTGSRLIAQEIDVLYDVTGGGSQTGADDDFRTSEVRGTVRSVDTRNRTLEIEGTRYGSSFSTGGTAGTDVVTVHYDAQTTVEYQGRRYSPETLERGDRVEVEVREVSGRLMAEEILVTGESSLTR